MRRLNLIIYFVIIFYSCKNFKIISRSVYSNHVKISENKLIKHLLKNEIDTSNIYFANDSFYIKIFSPQFQSDSTIDLNSFRPIQFRVFDSSGKIVNIWANCYGPMSFYIKDYNDLLIKRMNQNIILSTKLTDYTSLMKTNPIINTNKYDIIIIAFWAWYMDKFSIKLLRELQLLSNFNNKKVLIIKLNIDNSK
ncbi:MAG: hypothetical protein IT243_02775 [Bacteroidia bacterium]|nr:hypothetical protein [Bacteroidia bacterium]